MNRRAFTLLEVVLALAILGLALATFGQAVRRSFENARAAERESELTIVAQSVLDELVSGLRPLAEFEREPYAKQEGADPIAWVSGTVEQGAYDGLLVIAVRVDPVDGEASAINSVRLVRWLVDPSLESAGQEAEGGAS